MILHDLIQGSPEWHEFRRTHIGASDAPKIFLRGKEALLKEKLHGKSAFKTKAMQRGHDLEPVARALFEEQIGCQFPSAVVTHEGIEWMSASLDGICLERKEILEVKCCSKEIHEDAKLGSIPRDHLIQIQHALFVTDYELAHYCHFDGNEIVVVPIKRDPTLIGAIVKECCDFYEEFSKALKTQNSELEEIAAPVFHHERGEALMRELSEIRSRKSPLCEREKQLRAEILEIAPDHNFVLDGVLVYRSKEKITYDIQQMKVDGIDVAKYEKIGKPSWTISSK